MSNWRLAAAIPILQAEVNKAYPNRPRGSDGTIGDIRHQHEQSDHNPNPPHAGVVTAWDITTDPAFTDERAEKLRLMGAAGDGRVKYVIFKHRFTSDQHGWQWVPYDTPNGVRPGGDPHTEHIHLSVGLHDDEHQYDRTDPWNVFTHPNPAPAPSPTPDPSQEQDMIVIYAPGKPTALLTGGTLKNLESNDEKDALAAAGVPVKGITAEAFTLIQAVAAR